MNTNRLLAIASWWCGEKIAALIFQPLLADWQKELEQAHDHGRWQVARVAICGGGAYLLSLGRCAMSARGWLPTSRAAQIAAVTMFFTLDAAFLLIWIAALASGASAEPGAVQTRYFLLAASGIAVPSILLPALFLMRRDTQSTARHAVSAIAFGMAFTAVVVTLTAPERLNAYFSTFEAFESEYQRNLANDRAGHVTYPATALRERSAPTTVEQRRANYEQFMARRAEQAAKRPPLTWQQQSRRYQPVALAALFGIIGWTLAGLSPPTLPRAVMWWALMYVALFTFGVRPMTSGLPSIGRTPGALALAFFAAVATALVIGSWRRHEAPKAP